jgi:hypothetical protein
MDGLCSSKYYFRKHPDTMKGLKDGQDEWIRDSEEKRTRLHLLNKTIFPGLNRQQEEA